jgi:hypothetical protein
MSIPFYVISTLAVFIFSGLLAMAGLGAAFLFVPLFYYMGLPLAEATSSGRECCERMWRLVIGWGIQLLPEGLHPIRLGRLRQFSRQRQPFLQGIS